MASTIQLRRRIGGAAGAPATLAAGEPAYNDTGNTLHIGDGTGVQILVSSARQLELEGAQTVTTGAANAKTWDTTNFKFSGGSAGDVLKRGTAAGDVEWGASGGDNVSITPIPPSTADTVQAALAELFAGGAAPIAIDSAVFDGDGTTGDPLTLIAVDGGTY